jgi:transcriptional regulator with XRE-family HTH domain
MRQKSSNPIDTYVGNRLRMRRMMLGLSQTKLADTLGLTFQQVQKYEKGTNRLSASKLLQCANFLKVPVTFFFEGAPGAQGKGTTRPPADYVSHFLATKDGLALVKAFTQIKNAKLKRRIVDLVEEFTNQ